MRLQFWVNQLFFARLYLKLKKQINYIHLVDKLIQYLLNQYFPVDTRRRFNMYKTSI